MPFTEQSKVSLRKEFLQLFLQPGVNKKALCERYGISRDTAYRLHGRYLKEGDECFQDKSRRPKSSPNRTAPELEKAVLEIRRANRTWCGRKIRKRLQELEHKRVPAASTITEILRRNGCIEEAESTKREHFKRFEHEAPNDLWQGDFKGKIRTGQGWCHPLGLLDDHSRFSLTISACRNESRVEVHPYFVEAFRRYGLPKRMLFDNGSPWGYTEDSPYTTFAVWLMRLGIEVLHSKPRHPQTHGKQERFNRSLLEEVLMDRQLDDLPHCQRLFDQWRHVYNFERPHDALNLDVPAKRYVPSPRAYPETLPAIEYASGTVRKVIDARISFNGQKVKVGKAFEREYVVVRETTTDGVWEVYYSRFKIKTLDLTNS